MSNGSKLNFVMNENENCTQNDNLKISTLIQQCHLKLNRLLFTNSEEQ